MRPASLFGNRNFLLLWVDSLLSNLALAIAMLAETWYVVKTLDAKEQLGYVMIAGAVPRILLMTVGGVVADRFRRSRIMALTMILRVILLVAVVGLLAINQLNIVTLTIFALLYGVVDAFFWPAASAILPSLVREEDLTRANSVMLTTNQLGMVFGPVIATALLALFSYSSIFMIAAVGLGIGTVCMLLIHEPALPERLASQTGNALRNLVAELKEGMVYTIQTPVLRSMMIIYAIANLLFMGPISLGAPLIVTEHLGGDVKVLGWIQSAGAAGMVASGILLTLFPPKSRRLLMITLIIFVEGILLAFQGHSYWVWLAVALQFLLGFCIVCNNVPMMSVLQQYTAPDKMGRVMSLNTVASMGLSPVSYALVTGLLALHVEIGWIMRPSELADFIPSA